MVAPGWRVLVLPGASGTGKSTVAETIARRWGMSWMQVDDLRMALQFSRATLPEHNDALYYFLDNPEYVLQPPEVVGMAFVGMAQALIPAVRIAIESHVATNAPMVIEGDGIHPALAIDPALQTLVRTGVVRFCCVEATSHRELFDNMTVRGRGMQGVDLERAARHADANWAFNHWLAATSRSLGIPVVSSQPFATLADRIEEAVRSGPG